MPISRSDAIAACVTTTNDQHPFPFAVDEVFCRDIDTFQQAILLAEQLQREMDSFQVTPLNGKITGNFRANRQTDRVKVVHDVAGQDLFSDHGIGLENDPFLFHELYASVDDVLSQFEVGDTETKQSARSLIFLEYRDFVAFPVELICRGQSGGAATDYRHPFPVALRVMRLDITFPKGHFDDGDLVLSDGNRLVAAQFQDTTLLAQCGADTSRKLREVACLLQNMEGLFPMTFIEFVLPFRLFVAKRTGPMAKGDTTIHAPRRLCAAVVAVEGLLNFTEIFHSFVNGPVAGLFSMYRKECFWISHDFLFFVVFLNVNSRVAFLRSSVVIFSSAPLAGPSCIRLG